MYKSIRPGAAALVSLVLLLSLLPKPLVGAAEGDPVERAPLCEPAQGEAMAAEVPEESLEPQAPVTEPPSPEEILPAEEILPTENSDPEQAVLADYSFLAMDRARAEEIAQTLEGRLISFRCGIATVRMPAALALSRTGGIKLYPEYEYVISQTEEAPPEEIPDQSLAQWHLEILKAREAWPCSMGQGILVAVIDTGIDAGHEDLADGVAGVETTIPEEHYGELAMFPPEYRGGMDNLGHGTHVAGILGARKNGMGTTGVAPECQILSIKALEASGAQGRGRSSWVAAAINLAVERGADIINLSAGGTIIKDELLRVAVENAQAAGILVVCAAGNVQSPVPTYPGAFDGTLSVSALKPQGDFVTFASSYSNSGDWIDFAAPGSGILSTVPGGYEMKTGTSMACPMISGALALLLSADPLLTGSQACDLLRQTARDLGDPGKDHRYGHGLPDLQAMTVLHQHRQQPDVPTASVPTDSLLFSGTPISLSTDTLHGTVVYTLDGSEPNEESPRCGEPLVLPEETARVCLTARTLAGDGSLGEPVRLHYRFVPRTSLLTEAAGEIAGELPDVEEYPDLVLGLPCIRYQLSVPAGQELRITLPEPVPALRPVLLDGPGGDAAVLEWIREGQSLAWYNPAEVAQGVILSWVRETASQETGERQFSFAYTVAEPIPEETEPIETEPIETEPMETEPEETRPIETEPEETRPKETQPRETQPRETQPVPTEPAETQPALILSPETLPEAVIPEYEEDWLYAMDIPPETETGETKPAALPEEGGENGPMEEMDLKILLAGGIVMLAGLALALLGYFTGRKSWRLIREGENTQATVLRILRCTDFHTFQYQMTYRTRNGTQITANWKEHPRIRFKRRHPEGSCLTIRYLPEEPEEFMVVGHPIAAVCSGGCLVLGLGIMLLGIRIACLMFTIG